MLSGNLELVLSSSLSNSIGILPSLQKGLSYTLKTYCGWLKFRGVPIFMVFMEGPIHEFNGDSLY